MIIAALIGLLKYAQTGNLEAAILNDALMAFAGTLLLIGINLITTVMRINTYYKQKKLADFTVAFAADKTGIHATSDRGEPAHPWNRIVEVRETAHAFYLFITDTHANVLPKDQFASSKDLDIFRSLLVKNMDASRLKIKNG